MHYMNEKDSKKFREIDDLVKRARKFEGKLNLEITAKIKHDPNYRHEEKEKKCVEINNLIHRIDSGYRTRIARVGVEFLDEKTMGIYEEDMRKLEKLISCKNQI